MNEQRALSESRQDDIDWRVYRLAKEIGVNHWDALGLACVTFASITTLDLMATETQFALRAAAASDEFRFATNTITFLGYATIVRNIRREIYDSL